ncbi:hypothetical protein H7I76_16905 [Mycolicibacterium vaccae]|nr:hypothetical protein [Mycolicibacterium vaccae]
MIEAILGTREGALEGGYQLMSTGVTWTEPSEVGALRDGTGRPRHPGCDAGCPAARRGRPDPERRSCLGYDYIALLFVEAGSATLAVVDTPTGRSLICIASGWRVRPTAPRPPPSSPSWLSAWTSWSLVPVVCSSSVCGVDVIPIKQHLEAAASLPVSVAEEPDMALARGAALASANAPLFASSTAALAYSKDPGTGEVRPGALASYRDANVASGALAYSAIADEADDTDEPKRQHRPYCWSAAELRQYSSSAVRRW